MSEEKTVRERGRKGKRERYEGRNDEGRARQGKREVGREGEVAG